MFRVLRVRHPPLHPIYDTRVLRLDNQEQQKRHHDDWHRAHDQHHIITRASALRDEVVPDYEIFELPKMGKDVEERGHHGQERNYRQDPDRQKSVGGKEKRQCAHKRISQAENQSASSKYALPRDAGSYDFRVRQTCAASGTGWRVSHARKAARTRASVRLNESRVGGSANPARLLFRRRARRTVFFRISPAGVSELETLSSALMKNLRRCRESRVYENPSSRRRSATCDYDDPLFSCSVVCSMWSRVSSRLETFS